MHMPEQHLAAQRRRNILERARHKIHIPQRASARLPPLPQDVNLHRQAARQRPSRNVTRSQLAQRPCRPSRILAIKKPPEFHDPLFPVSLCPVLCCCR